MNTVKYLSRRPMDTLLVWLMDKKKVHSTWPSENKIAIFGAIIAVIVAFLFPNISPAKEIAIVVLATTFFILLYLKNKIDEVVNETVEHPDLIYKAIALKARKILSDKMMINVTLGTYISFVESIFSLPVNHRFAILKESDVSKVFTNLTEILKNEGIVFVETRFSPQSHDVNIFTPVTTEVEVDYRERLSALLETMQEKNISESPLETILMHNIEVALK